MWGQHKRCQGKKPSSWGGGAAGYQRPSSTTTYFNEQSDAQTVRGRFMLLTHFVGPACGGVGADATRGAALMGRTLSTSAMRPRIARHHHRDRYGGKMPPASQTCYPR